MKSMKSTVERTDEGEVLKILSEQAPVGVCIAQDGKFCYFNSNFPIAIGYTAFELVGKDPLELIVPEDREMVMENEIKMLKGELLTPYQFRVIHKDGSIRWVIATVRSVQYHGRRAVLGNYMEVTERKQMEESLKESEEKYRELADSITDVFFAMDEHLRYSYWNRASEILTGIRAVDAIGKSIREIFPDKPWRRRAEKVYRSVLRTQQPQTFVNDYDIDGRHYIFEISAYPSRGGISVFVSDITERMQAEEVLQAEKNKLQSVIDAMDSTLTIQDTEYSIIFQNEPSKKSTDGDRTGEKCYRAYEGREKVCEGCPVEKAFKDGKSHTAERRTITSGEVAFWENTANPIRDASGEIVSCLEIARNITERKKQEQALADEAARRHILVDQSIDGIVVLDEDAKVCEANQRFAEMLGYTPEEIHELHTWDWDKNFPPEQILEMGRNVDEKGLHLETKHTRKDGSVFDVDISINGTMCGGQKLIFCVCRDITERKQARETLQAEKNKLQSLIDAMEDGLTIQDRGYNIIYQNESLKEILGDHVGEKCYRAYAHEDKVCNDCPLARAFRDGKSHSAEKKVKLPSGKVAFWEPTANPVRDAKGKIVSCLEVIRDITERKRAEEALRHSEEKHRALFDSSVIGMFVMDAETMKIVMCNGAAAKMFGFSSVEEAVGINPLDFVLPEHREEALEITIKEMFEKDLRRTHEYWVVNKDGREGWVSVTGARIMHEGRLAGLVSITDITERKQAVEALGQSEERYRTILEDMEDAYFEVDLGGHFTFVNNSVCRDLGYSREELIGMSYKDFTAKDNIESVFQVFNEVYRTGVPNKGFPWKTVRKDGVCGFAETSVSTLRNDNGEIIGFRGVGRDVTERKRAEDKLRQSEENYKTLFNSSVVGMYVLDVKTMKVVMGNRAAAEMAGFSSVGNGIGINPLDFVIPEDREQVLEVATKEFEQDLRRTHEVRVVGKDGETGWISITGAKIMHKGRLAALVSFTDITEHKQAEEALELQKAYFQQLFDNSPDAILMMDTNDRAIQANRGFEVLFGYSNEEAKGRSLIELIVPEVDAQEASDSLQRILGGKVVRKESVRRRKDGSLVDVSVLAYPIRSNDKLIGTYGVYSDITERKQAEEKLRQSEENYRVLFDSTVIGTIVLDAETMKIAMVNQAAAKMFGFGSAEEARGADWLDFIRPEDKDRISKIAAENLFGQDSRQTYELGVLNKDGREIWINATGARIMHEGKLGGLISFTDITEQKRQRERLMVTDRLASLGELAAGAAHELNNPLTSIIGFSQLLMEKETPDDIREDLKLINNEAQRAVKVTRDLLTFARKHGPVKQPNQINSIIEDVLELRAYLQKTNGIEVERQLAPDLPEIMVDYFQMQQVLLNIIINAEYFMTQAHNKGTLTITTKKENGTVKISFVDDGPGITPENLGRIFDPFFTTKEAGSGTGLGLSICHGIVNEHGGQIYVRSQLGKGATVFVELPIKSRAHIKSML